MFMIWLIFSTRFDPNLRLPVCLWPCRRWQTGRRPDLLVPVCVCACVRVFEDISWQMFVCVSLQASSCSLSLSLSLLVATVCCLARPRLHPVISLLHAQAVDFPLLMWLWFDIDYISVHRIISVFLLLSFTFLCSSLHAWRASLSRSPHHKTFIIIRFIYFTWLDASLHLFDSYSIVIIRFAIQPYKQFVKQKVDQIISTSTENIKMLLTC